MNLRYWMDVCEPLTESLERVTVRGRTVIVQHNPTERTLLAALDRSSMRGLVDAHSLDTFWWDAHAAIHEEVGRQLGLDFYMAARLVLIGKDVPVPELTITIGIDTALKSPSIRYLTAKNNILVRTPGQMMFDAVPFAKFQAYWLGSAT